MNQFFYYGSTICIALALLSGCNKQKGAEAHTHIHEAHNRAKHHHTEHDTHATHHHSNEVDAAHAHQEKQAHASSEEIVISPTQAQAAGIVSERIDFHPFRHVLLVGGKIESAQGEEQTIVAKTSGIVSFAQPLTEGKSINPQHTLLTISARNLQDGDPAERAQITYETARKEYERATNLIKDKLISEKEFIRIQEAYENARLGYNAIVTKDKNNGSAVHSPINGYIKNCLVNEGDYVNVGQPLLLITRNNRLYLRADVPEKHYALLNKITSANFRTSYSEQVYALQDLNGKLLSYGRASGKTPFYIPVTFAMDNREGLFPGSYAEVYLLSEEIPHVLSVPHTALTEEQGIYFVYIQLDNECYQRREVKIGLDNGKEVQLLSGIHAGERVVTQGAYHVKLASIAKSIPGHSHEH